MNIKTLSVITFALWLTGCDHSIRMAHFSDFSPYQSTNNGSVIVSQAQQDVVFWFADNVDYVDLARDRLEVQCPNGKITGISTEFITSLGFLSWTNYVHMSGRCII